MAKKKRGRGRPRKPTAKKTVKAKAIEKDLYETYIRAWDKSRDVMARKIEKKLGRKLTTKELEENVMYGNKLSEREFYDTYATYYYDAKAEVNQGTKKTTGNVVLQMVSDQRFEMTKKQAISLYLAAYENDKNKEFDGKFTQKLLDDIRNEKVKMVNDFVELLKKQNDEEKQAGHKSLYRAKEIANTWFGSNWDLNEYK